MISLLKRIKEENGQSMVLFAVLLVVLLGFAALALDIGMMKIAESEMQNAADAAVFAAVEQLPDINAATNTALVYGQLNGAEAANITVTTPYDGDDSKIEVVCIQPVQFTFAKVLGFNSGEVSARAVASKGTGGVEGTPFDYALFSGSSTAVSRLGTKAYIVGNIHGNNDLDIQGEKSEFYGDIESVYNIFLSGNKTTVYGDVQASNITIPKNSGLTVTGTQLSLTPNYIDMPDLSSIVTTATANAKYKYVGNTGFSGNSNNFDGTIYVDGSLGIHSSNVTFDGAIIATGDIMITGSNIRLTGKDGISLCSLYGNIYIYGNTPEITGLIYAPNGAFKTSAHCTVNGTIIANYFEINASGLTVTYDDSYIDILGLGGDSESQLVE